MKIIFKSRIIRISNGCWEYRHRPNAKYGRVKYQGKEWRAHVLSFTLFKGPIPKGKMVLHKCDNRPCIRPAHLYAGTKSDNAKDMWSRNLVSASKRRRKAKIVNRRPKIRAKISRTMSRVMRKRWRLGFYDNHRRWRLIRKRGISYG